MRATGERDGFGVHSLAYYQRAYQLFQPSGAGALFIARFQGRPLAGLMAFARGRRGWYFYGASTDEERNRMPAYLLQLEAMRWAAARGCKQYDLWGVPDEDEETLESQFEKRSDGLWGVYRFKRGFGGQLKRAAPAYELALIPPLYRVYRWWARRRSLE
jgi:lipid II:glycine glycyltransferase (peptidoglycan interpeptide bridge formation enzyme)